MAAGVDCDGQLEAKHIDDHEYLARRLNSRLVSEAEFQDMGASNPDIGMMNVTHSALLSRCVQQLILVGLLRVEMVDTSKVYVVPGFTKDNHGYLSNSTVRQRNYRQKSEKDVTHAALPSRSVTHAALASRLEEKEEKEREDIVAVATSKKTRKAKTEETDEAKERRKSLIKALEASFSNVRGQPYGFQGAKDGNALKWLIANSDDSEILRRFEAGLKLEKWPRIDSIAQLRSNWNSLAALPAQSATVHNLTFSQREQLEQEERRKAEREKQKRLEAKLEADRKVEWWEPLERGEIWDMWFQRQQELEAAGEFEKLAPTYQRQKKG